MWMGHVTHMDESFNHVLVCQVHGVVIHVATYFVMPHICLSHVTHLNESCHTFEWVMSHIWMSHVTHLNESSHTFEWVMSHIWMSHVTHLIESRHTSDWVMSHIWMSHVTHMNESCHTYTIESRCRNPCRHTHDPIKYVGLWMSRFTQVNESWHAFDGVMSHIWMSHVTHIQMSHVPRMNVICCAYPRVMSHMMCRNLTPAHSAIAGGSNLYIYIYIYTNVSCSTYKWCMFSISVSHVTLMNESLHTYEWVVSHIYECVMSHVW